MTKLIPTEIVRMLLLDGHTLESGIRYCQEIAREIHYGAYTNKDDEASYIEAAQILENRVKSERLAEDRVQCLEQENRHLLSRLMNMEKTVLRMMDQIHT